MKIIDLFAGAGGISLGASRAGFEVAAAVELDPFAIETHIKNFPLTVHLNRDVSTLSGEELLSLAGVGPGELSGLVGGPPCQGFSTIGKGEVNDPRNNLFHHFFRLVRETSPVFFVAENVPGIMSEKYESIRDKAFSQVSKEYVILPPIEVKASDCGAPTTRTRIFFFGYKKKILNRSISKEDIQPEYRISPVVSKALYGLPVEINPDWQTEEDGWRPYKLPTEEGHFFDRVSGVIPQGVGNSNALERYHRDGLVSSCQGTKHSGVVSERYGALEHGKADRISKSIRLNPNGYCPTLRAGTGKDKGSYQAVRPIHHIEPRVITPREAARLQGFPDWFVFHSTKWHSFRQIGNSVSPIVAEGIFAKVMRVIASEDMLLAS
ncbi:DNA cytosine methyltransferase [Gallaecimonas sp. GXIMD1310]|uniref:DNA cytosine methyltransferase n=1 Tax=Gallaecimonas sp. GXIMD1310 TaxID=3131926 RepID=UPI003253D3FC